MKRITIIGLVVVLLMSMLLISTASATTYGTVTGGWLRLRSGPSFSSTIYKSYYTGTVVEILDTSGSWYQVKTPDGYTGYMYSSYVTLGGGGTGYTAYVTSSNGLGVRLRSGPSKGYRVLAVYSVGTQVTVLQTGILWSRIQVGSTVGYMMSEFLTTTPGPIPTTSPSGDMATVRSDNGYGVRLRSGPGTGYSIIGLYSVGTRVSVITRGTDWDYIQVGSRLGYMMNYYLTYDTPTQRIATGITVTAASSSGMQGEYVALTTSVTGTNLSSPAYTLAVTGNSSMAEISGDDLHILSTATVGASIVVTATTVDNNSSGSKITATCTVTVTASEPRVTAFSFDQTSTTVSIASGSVQRRIGYSISGYDLSSPYFTLAVSSAAGSHVTTSIDETNEEIVLNISSAIADGTVFTVTGTTTANDSGGNPKTATLTVTITDDVVSLSSIVITSAETALRHDEMSGITAVLHYSDGSYSNASTADYTLSVTTGSTYASITTDTIYKLVPNAVNLVGVADQTIVVTGTAVADTSVTDTISVLLYGRNTPDPPTLTSISAADQKVTVHWTAPADDGGDDLTFYKLYYSTTETGTKTIIDESISTSVFSYEKTGLLNGTTYYLWMLAANDQGNSTSYSNYLTATPSPTRPSAPQNLSVSTRGDGFVTLTWDPPADTGGSTVSIDHYVVYVDNAGATNVAAPPITCSGLTNAQTYTFSVYAVNDYFTDPGPVSEITSNPVGTPGAPAITSLATGSGSITINWSAPTNTNGSDIANYYVYCKPASDADPLTPTDTVLGSVLTYTFSGLSNQEYQVWVKAFNGYYPSTDSNRENRTPTTVPAAPASLTVTSEGNQEVSLSWPASTSDGGSAITEYTVYYNGTEFIRASGDELNLTETVTGLANGTTYTFSVYAVNTNGASAAVTATGTPSTLPSPPSTLNTTKDASSITLSWPDADDGGSAITAYIIYFDGDPSPYTRGDDTATTETFTGLSSATTYSFEVFSQNANGTSTTSATTSATTD